VLSVSVESEFELKLEYPVEIRISGVENKYKYILIWHLIGPWDHHGVKTVLNTVLASC